jgi:hypothetical protein
MHTRIYQRTGTLVLYGKTHKVKSTKKYPFKKENAQEIKRKKKALAVRRRLLEGFGFISTLYP